MSQAPKIAILYSDKDDELIAGGINGWVSNFQRFLDTLMQQISRASLQIDMINEEEFNEKVLLEYNCLLVVTTENLVAQSNICTALDLLAKRLKKADDLIVGGVSRIFKVLKKPYSAEEALPELEDLISYDFFLIDPLTGDPQEFTRFFGSDAERSYWMKLVDMAYDITHVLNTKPGSKKDDLAAIPREKTVYLASTGVDMVIQRDIIKRELIRHGYKVLPDHSLPKEIKSLERMVRDDLDRCRLSIHLIGEDYGYKPKGSDLSVVDIQNRIASDHTHQMADKNKELSQEEKQPFSRLIWVSPDLNNISERQKIFIEDLKSDAASLEEAEVLQIQLQELKSIIREELVTGGRLNAKRYGRVGSAEKKKEASAKIIYLIADKRDVKQIDEVRNYLSKKGFTVVAPTYEGDLVDLRYIHQENLRRCDASLIFYGEASQEWINTKLQDLLKAPGFGRDKPIQAKGVYFKAKREIDTGHFERNNALILGNRDEAFEPDDLTPFLTKIQN
ncbi:MAG: DUF4062 domain-containing protein [Bacteroidota bacterium]